MYLHSQFNHHKLSDLSYPNSQWLIISFLSHEMYNPKLILNLSCEVFIQCCFHNSFIPFLLKFGWIYPMKTSRFVMILLRFECRSIWGLAKKYNTFLYYNCSHQLTNTHIYIRSTTKIFILFFQCKLILLTLLHFSAWTSDMTFIGTILLIRPLRYDNVLVILFKLIISESKILPTIC